MSFPSQFPPSPTGIAVGALTFAVVRTVVGVGFPWVPSDAAAAFAFVPALAFGGLVHYCLQALGRRRAERKRAE